MSIGPNGHGKNTKKLFKTFHLVCQICSSRGQASCFLYVSSHSKESYHLLAIASYLPNGHWTDLIFLSNATLEHKHVLLKCQRAPLMKNSFYAYLLLPHIPQNKETQTSNIKADLPGHSASMMSATVFCSPTNHGGFVSLHIWLRVLKVLLLFVSAFQHLHI